MLERFFVLNVFTPRIKLMQFGLVTSSRSRCPIVVYSLLVFIYIYIKSYIVLKLGVNYV